MERINLEIEKYSFVYDDNEKYFVYAIPVQNKTEYTGFYIQKEKYDFIFHCTTLSMNQMNCTNEEFIEENIMEWTNFYEDEIDILE